MVRTNPLFLDEDGFVAADGATFSHATGGAADGPQEGLGTRYYPRDASMMYKKDWVGQVVRQPIDLPNLHVLKAPTTSLVLLQVLQDTEFLPQRYPICPCCG